MVNNTKHYPVTFPSIAHLLDFAEADKSIYHPLGIVYKTKIASHDNRVRIVALNDSRGGRERLEAFIFNNTQWADARNPFAPEYHEAEQVAMRMVIRAGNRVRKAIIGIIGYVYQIIANFWIKKRFSC